MALEIPKSRLNVRQIQTQKRNIPLDQIIAVQGQNPLATGIETTGAVIGQALARNAELKRQGQQIAQLATMAGEQVPGENSLTPDMYEKGLGLKATRQSKAAERAKARTELEFKLEQLRGGYTEKDPITGAERTIPGVQGLSIKYDPDGNPYASRDENYQPKLEPSKKADVKGSLQQSTYVDADGTPLFFDRDARSYVRSDGRPALGMPVPSKGNAEAITSTSKARELLPKIDVLFDALNAKSDLSARASLVPGVAKVFYPEINQLKAEVKQIGFTFGGKNFTGNEEKIITDALIPSAFDNPESREAKRTALKGYISGQIDLLGAANLLGAAGSNIKNVIQGRKGLHPLETPKPTALPVLTGKKKALAEELGL